MGRKSHNKVTKINKHNVGINYYMEKHVNVTENVSLYIELRGPDFSVS